MNIEGKYGIESKSIGAVPMEREKLASKIEEYLFVDLNLGEASIDASQTDAKGTVEAELYFNLINSNKQIIYNGISIDTDKMSFVSEIKKKIEHKINILNNDRYTIQTLLYEYKIPLKNHTNGDNYLVISKRSLPLA